MVKVSKCRNCKGPTKMWKCDICGSISDMHVPTHGCGGSHCMPMCATCRQAEALCRC